MIQGAVVLIDHCNSRNGSTVGRNGRHREEGLAENIGSSLHRINRTTAANTEEQISFLNFRIVDNFLDVCIRRVFSVNSPFSQLNAGLFKASLQGRSRLGQRCFTADDGSCTAIKASDLAKLVVARRTDAVMRKRHCIVLRHWHFSVKCT